MGNWKRKDFINVNMKLGELIFQTQCQINEWKILSYCCIQNILRDQLAACVESKTEKVSIEIKNFKNMILADLYR